jgi:MoxR-like ATPase
MQLIEKTAPFIVSLLDRVHEFDQDSVDAVNSALASGRPLLVRGEPGVGKTQLAEAAAEHLQRAFVPFVVNSRTEARDLLWRFDAVMRLAEAQILSQITQDEKELREKLAVSNFVRPGPLWWACHADDAERCCTDEDNMLTVGQNAARSKHGWVVLIDEIDKAESDLPNGLLEALGAQSFRPQGRSAHVTIPAQGVAPLIVVTTNEDRVLPDAFVRRCMVLHLNLPADREALVAHLCQRGKAHFGQRTSDQVLSKAAGLLADDREAASASQLLPLPGQAEFLDLMRAVIEWKGSDLAGQEAVVDTVRTFAYRKHAELR